MDLYESLATLAQRKARCTEAMKTLPRSVGEKLKMDARQSLVAGQTIGEDHPVYPVLLLRAYEKYVQTQGT